MKRLSTCHRKTPVSKEDKCPNFYELAKTSPLPEITLQPGGGPVIGSMVPDAHLSSAMGGQMPGFSFGGVPGASLGSLGGQLGMDNNQMLSRLLTNDARSVNVNSHAHSRLAQLQRDNEDLRRRIMMMESKQPQGGGSQLGGMAKQSMGVPDQFASLSNPAAGVGGIGNLERELGRMQRERDFMMNPMGGMANPAAASSMNNPVNNSMNNSLLSSLGGGAPGGSSFMSGFPRDEMLLRAMRLENQMGLLPKPASGVNSLKRALGGQGGGSSTTPDGDSQEGRRKAMVEWMAKKQGGA